MIFLQFDMRPAHGAHMVSNICIIQGVSERMLKVKCLWKSEFSQKSAVLGQKPAANLSPTA